MVHFSKAATADMCWEGVSAGPSTCRPSSTPTLRSTVMSEPLAS
jgi:hypothetical protein